MTAGPIARATRVPVCDDAERRKVQEHYDRDDRERQHSQPKATDKAAE